MERSIITKPKPKVTKTKIHPEKVRPTGPADSPNMLKSLIKFRNAAKISSQLNEIRPNPSMLRFRLNLVLLIPVPLSTVEELICISNVYVN